VSNYELATNPIITVASDYQRSARHECEIIAWRKTEDRPDAKPFC